MSEFEGMQHNLWWYTCSALMVNKPLKHCWDATEGCKLVSNPSYNESDEIMVSFMMYMVSDSDKWGAKGVQ